MGFERMLSRHGLSQGRFCTLIVAFRSPNHAIGASDLADKVGVSKATMTGLLDGLEREELIERRLHSEDRRKTDIVITPKGQTLLESLFPDYYARTAKLMGVLEEHERELLVEILGRVADRIEEL